MVARIADIAAAAGVSQATVSRVLNDRPGVVDSKRQSVLAALDRLGYERPSRLRGRAGRPVGLVLPELSNPVFPAFAQAMSANLARRGFAPVLSTQGQGGVHEDECIDMLLEAGAVGIIFVSGRHSDTSVPLTSYQRLRDSGMPLALVGGYRSDLDAAFFSVDDLGSMSLVVRHLVSLGHRRIGMATGPASYVAVQRKVEGFHRAIAEQIAPDAEAPVVHSMLTDDGGLSAGRELIAQGCTAIVCASDLMALGVIAEARREGLRVPGDLSVVGFDDSILARHAYPPLTTVRQPTTAMSIAVVDALIGEINGIPAARTEYLFQPELVVRESTGVAPT